MSTIKVNKLEQRSGCTATVGGGSGKTVVVDATTVTLGRCGGTVALASGASQSGFGRSGSVNWQTTPKTATFTAADGEGYFINSGSAITANLPAGSAGAIVAFSDYARNFNTHNFTIAPNGSEKIGGEASDLTLNVNGQALTLVYVDSTKGWVNVQNAEDTEVGALPYVTATGGTISNSGNFRIHTFTGPGTFCVSAAGTAPPSSGTGSNLIDYMVVGGGGGSGGMVVHIQGGGGGGAGGFRASPGAASGCYAASPRGAAPAVSLPAPVAAYPITVGGGGSGGTQATPGPDVKATAGINSVAALSTTITAAGGGEGAMGSPSSNPNVGGDGGSGGGGAYNAGGGGTGNSPPVNPAQGSNGGPGAGPGQAMGGSGGGATGAGVASPNCGTNPTAGTGGAGATSCITASPVTYATGGNYNPYNPGSWTPMPNAADNTGNGANGQNAAPSPLMPVPSAFNGVNGGSGIVVIRYKYQN